LLSIVVQGSKFRAALGRMATDSGAGWLRELTVPARKLSAWFADGCYEEAEAWPIRGGRSPEKSICSFGEGHSRIAKTAR
jgi:hypothetical protein